MQSIRQALFIGIAVIGLVIGLAAISSAQTVSYTYDGLNRLIRVDYGDGNVVEYIYDQAGNRIYVGALDTTPPVTTASPASGTFFNTTLSVTLTCNDGTGSGCNKTYYTTDGSTPTTSSSVYTSPIQISATTTLKFFSVSNGGNSESVETATYTLDSTPPTTTASPVGGIYNVAQTVTLTCTDNSGGSGCNKTYYTTDGSTPTTSSPVYSSPINISSAGTTTLNFFSTDIAGNSETVKTQTYTIDITPPTGTIAINSGATSTNNPTVTLTLSCSDAYGCSQMQFSNDNVTYSTPQAYATTTTWTLTTGDGTKAVYVKFKDTPGNWSRAYSGTILLDTTPPTTTASPLGGTYYWPQSITLSCNDGAGSGCSKTYWSFGEYGINGTQWMQWTVYSSPIMIYMTTGDAILGYYSTDLVGNTEAIKVQTYTITYQPTGTISINSGAAYTKSTIVTLNLSCSAYLGCSKMKFSNTGSSYSAPETYASTKTWTLTSGNGTKTVYVMFQDSGGNWSSAYNATILLDTTAPTTSASPAAGTYTGSVTVTLQCTDNSGGSGCNTTYYSTDKSTPSIVYTGSITITSTTTLKFYSTDNAGNSEAVVSKTYTIK